MKFTLNKTDLQNLSQHPVFWLILSLSLVITPHLSRFPIWSIFLIVLLFSWRLLCIKRPHWLPPKWLLLIIIIFSSAGLFFHFGTLFGKTAGSVLLSILLAVKLHESQSRRDYMLLISLSFFIIVTNFLFSQSIPTVIFMLCITVILLISMITINQNNAAIDHLTKLKLAVKMLFQALPLMLILFVLFPRISGPLWKLPEEDNTARSGLSDTMSPGDISNLIKSSSVAFRVQFKNEIPPQQNLYWRGLVLWYFDGQTWERGKKNTSPEPTLFASKNKIDYTITLQAHHKKWLYALDMPVDVPEDIVYTKNFVLRSQHKITSLYQYQLTSSLDYKIQSDISPWEKSAGLKIPPQSNLKTVLKGQQLAQRFSQAEDIVDHVLKTFTREEFHYTLKPPLTPGFDPVDQFLFQTKRGFCEHYASSFTLLMRAAGIPARVVLGYQGGTINPLTKVLTVRQSEAHAWSEVWLQDRGWVRIDPTAAIAPQRIEKNLDAALDINETRPLHIQLSSSALRDIFFYWDAIDNRWNQWVIGYDTDKQKQLLSKLFKQRIIFSDIILLLVTGFSVALMITLLFIFQPWKKNRLDPVIEAYNAFCKKLSLKGITRKTYEGPYDFSHRAIKALPEQKDSILLITRLYSKLRYESSHSDKQLIQLKQLIREFNPGRTPER
jgi:protein-glutamine gamma-glutamyltransferase